MDNWNPEQYNRFHSERSQPFWDLALKVDFTKVSTLLDIGCGTGELTSQLHSNRGLKTTVGIDSSASMLEKASAWRAKGLTFTLGDANTYAPSQKYDVVLSNSALQWVDNHKQIILKLANWLEPKGQLAVQMPCNFDHASHFLASDVAQEMKLKIRTPPLLAPETYAELLWRNGMEAIDVTIKVYLHPMETGTEVVEWTKGTLLTYYQKQLDVEGFKKFVSEYTRRLLVVTGQGAYLYPFKRIFIVVRKK